MITPIPPAPVPAAERIVALDIVRGFALFGILLVNMQDFGVPANALAAQWSGAPDAIVSWLLRFAAEGKFVTIFSFLFGLGFALQLLRAEARGEPLTPRFLRRLGVLLMFGLAHYMLLWDGDILITYALIGVALLPFARRTPPVVLRGAMGVFALSLVMLVALFALTAGNARAPDGASSEEATTYAAYAAGSYPAAVALRLGTAYVPVARAVLSFPTTLALFLLGLWVGKRGIARDPAAHRPLLRHVVIWSVTLGVLGNLPFTLWGAQIRQYPVAVQALLAGGFGVGRPAHGLAYAAGLTLFLTRPVWLARLRPLAAVGRMALTNYLLQSVVCTTFFYGYGFGWYNRVSPTVGVALTVAVFAAQIPLSILWLRLFRFGPMEWVWRSLTYLHPVPLRRDSPFPAGLRSGGSETIR